MLMMFLTHQSNFVPIKSYVPYDGQNWVLFLSTKLSNKILTV